MDSRIIDLTCKNCGKSFVPMVPPAIQVTKLPGGGLMYTNNDSPIQLKCSHCGTEAMIFKPGEKTLGAASGGAVAIGNGARAVGAGGIMIGGNHSGNIVIGRGNIVVDGRRNVVSTSWTDDDDED